MGLINRFVKWVQGYFGCKHPYPEARVELIPEQEFVRYFWECSCGKQWDD